MSIGDVVNVAEGWYSIVCAADPTLAVDVYGGYGSNGTNVWIFSENENPSECFHITKAAAGGYHIWCGTNESKLFDSKGYYKSGQPLKNGVNLAIWDSDGGADQRWRFEESGSDPIVLNGVEYPLYNIVSMQDTSFALDCSGGSPYVRDNVLLWTKHRLTSQCFALVPVVQASTRTLSTPAEVSVFTTSDGAGAASAKVVGVNESAVVRPAWKGPYNDFQARYRITDLDGTVGPWASLVDGSKDQRGWGDKAFRAATSGDWRYCSAGAGVTVTAGQGISVEVRPCDCGNTPSSAVGAVSTATRHYQSAGCSVKVAQIPTVKATAASWSPLGIAVTMSASAGGDCSGTVTCEPYAKPTSFSGKAGSWQVILPTVRMPANGTTVTVGGTLRTGDGLVVPSWSSSVKLTYGDVSGAISPKLSRVGPASATIDLRSWSTHRAWVMVDGVVHELRDAADGLTWAPLPQADYSVFAAALVSGTWRTWSDTFTAESKRVYGLTWEGGSDEVIAGVGASPSMTWSDAADAQSDLTTGRSYELTTIGHGRKSKATIKGAWFGVADADARSTAILDSRFSWLTTPGGQLWRVAVKSCECEVTQLGYTSVSLEVTRSDG